MFCLKARGEDQTSLFEGCGELHPFFLRACSLPFFEQVEEIVRISFPYLERKEVCSCRLRGKRSSLSREVGEACLSVEKEHSLLSHAFFFL